MGCDFFEDEVSKTTAKAPTFNTVSRNLKCDKTSVLTVCMTTSNFLYSFRGVWIELIWLTFLTCELMSYEFISSCLMSCEQLLILKSENNDLLAFSNSNKLFQFQKSP